jgi:hypothetical protein
MGEQFCFESLLVLVFPIEKDGTVGAVLGEMKGLTTGLRSQCVNMEQRNQRCHMKEHLISY